MLIQRFDVYDNKLFLKFQSLVAGTSIQDADFTITDVDDNLISDALDPIDLERDYRPTARSLDLYFASGIQANTEYKLKIEGLKNGYGQDFSPVTIEFKTKSNTNVEIDPPLLERQFYVQDYSVAPITFDSTEVTEPATPNDDNDDVERITMVSSHPVDNSIYNNIDVIKVEFSHVVNPTVAEDFILVQKRKMSPSYTQWEDVVPVTFSTYGVTLNIAIPLTENNYKYRVVINKSLPSSGNGIYQLGIDYEFSFATVLTPFYSNPEEIVALSEVEITELQAAELIQRFSAEAQTLLGLHADQEPPFGVVEYVTASVLCHLAKLNGDVLGFESRAQSITLGDWQVSKGYGPRSSSSSKATRESANNWCELAAALKREMMAQTRVPRTWVRSGRHKNPIPSRYFKDLRTFKNRNSPHDFGLINDA